MNDPALLKELWTRAAKRVAQLDVECATQALELARLRALVVELEAKSAPMKKEK